MKNRLLFSVFKKVGTVVLLLAFIFNWPVGLGVWPAKQTQASGETIVTSFGSMTSNIIAPQTAWFVGGGFAITNDSLSVDIESVTLTEMGTIAEQTDLANVSLFYKMDTTAPYDCHSEVFDGGATLFGVVKTNGFDDVGGKALFSDVISVTPTASLCLYPVIDVLESATDGATLALEISDPSTEVVVSSGVVEPNEDRSISGQSVVQKVALTQTHYHWRNDNADESNASSASGGMEDTVVTDWTVNQPLRLRLGVMNHGLAVATTTVLRLEYATKITTCDMATVWGDVGASGDGWELSNSVYISDGVTTNISVGAGGVSDGGGNFQSGTGTLRETGSETATNTLSTNDFLEVEYSIRPNSLVAYDTTYCFRVSNQGVPLAGYNNYAELTTEARRDFFTQRGMLVVTGTSSKLIAGVDYQVPENPAGAFVRITNIGSTGAGLFGFNLNVRNVSANIVNASDLTDSFTIGRPTGATGSTTVAWEIVEFVGLPDTDNEVKVRDIRTVSLVSNDLEEVGAAVSGVASDNDVVVFVTGVSGGANNRTTFTDLRVTASWDAVNKQPVFTRSVGTAEVVVSYAVVEFTGINWRIQRVEHTYTATGVIQEESIAPVNLGKTFLHTQKRGTGPALRDFGQEVYLSSMAKISFILQSGTTLSGQTAVVWVIENTQVGKGATVVQRLNGTNNTLGSSFLSFSPVASFKNASVFINARIGGNDSNFPRALAGVRITSTSSLEIWRGLAESGLVYRAEIVEWPTVNMDLSQDYYRFYTNNDALLPTDPWPAGVADVGENTPITETDEPVAPEDVLRLRLAIGVKGANLPLGARSFVLQYGLRETTCSAIPVDGWEVVGDWGSAAPWRGFVSGGVTNGLALSTNPPTGGDLLISVSTRAGRLAGRSPSFVNPYFVPLNEKVEYDWLIEHNNALPFSNYCFRVINSDDTLLEEYNHYPQVRTAGFTPVSAAWRWYNGVAETPTAPLEAENVAPIEVAYDQDITLRLAIAETKNVPNPTTKFSLQYSEEADFSSFSAVKPTADCDEKTTEWCYTAGVGVDNTPISTALLGGVTCTTGAEAGCGSHNNTATASSTHLHSGKTTQEYSFAIKQKRAKLNTVYYFRLFDEVSEEVVPLADGADYPSLVTEGAKLVLTVEGLPAGTTTAEVVTNVEATPNSIGFGKLSFEQDYIAAHRLHINTNASEGYQVLLFSSQALQNASGDEISAVSGVNALPTAWSTACAALAVGCFGYHTSDGLLRGSSTRFALPDSYAKLSSDPEEVMYSATPTSDSNDIIYRMRIGKMQSQGDYETDIIYLVIPAF